MPDTQLPGRTTIEPIRLHPPPRGMESVREQAKSLQPSLVARAVAGDREAFRGLVEPHLPTALGAATALLRSPSEADDAVQDALLSAWLGLHQLRRADAFSGLVPPPRDPFGHEAPRPTPPGH